MPPNGPPAAFSRKGGIKNHFLLTSSRSLLSIKPTGLAGLGLGSSSTTQQMDHNGCQSRVASVDHTAVHALEDQRPEHRVDCGPDVWYLSFRCSSWVSAVTNVPKQKEPVSFCLLGILGATWGWDLILSPRTWSVSQWGQPGEPLAP
jgi:hypothetical protein